MSCFCAFGCVHCSKTTHFLASPEAIRTLRSRQVLSIAPYRHLPSKVRLMLILCFLQTMERRLIATARHLTLRLKRGVAAVSATASSVSGRVLPTAVQERLAQAMRFTEELCQSFAKVRCCECGFSSVWSRHTFGDSTVGQFSCIRKIMMARSRV